jgi:hypothetical protein
LPRAALRLEALSGLDTTLARQDVDLRTANSDGVAVPLRFLFRPEEDRLFAGNTHVHLRNLTREDAEAYLGQLPSADALTVLFISYLERRHDDRHYITNRYPVGPVPGFETTGVLVTG